MMWWLLVLAIYLFVSNIAIVVRLYRSFLRYLSPLKGYVTSLSLIFTLLAIDYAILDFTVNKIEKANEFHAKKAVTIQILEASLQR
ncbi:MAG: hypothetical protein NZ521_10980 [Flammeovirgaceae bacterium]|nr:hypothetical protein [Flammeovirgaceae bacterium]MDW8288727.1 hypothetical protein [Flammeovirgaceae bacterium]